MPLIPFALALLVVGALILATPLLLILRYRTGIARRPARRFVMTVNLMSMLISAALFLWLAAVTTLWMPRAFTCSCFGFIAGLLLGMLGLALTRWEQMPRALYYTPNRWLVLLLTLAVALRLLYSLWRIWYAWGTSGPDASWLGSAGIPGSMAIGAAVLGYYVIYFTGVRWRLR